MKKLIGLFILVILLFGCNKVAYENDSGVIGANDEVRRIQINKDDLPDNATYIKDMGKGFQLWKIGGNTFMVQRIRVNKFSYYDFTPYEMK